MVGNNFPKHKLIVPTLCARRYTLVLKSTSSRQGLPGSRLHGRIQLTIHGTGYPLPGGYDALLREALIKSPSMG